MESDLNIMNEWFVEIFQIHEGPDQTLTLAGTFLGASIAIWQIYPMVVLSNQQDTTEIYFIGVTAAD